MLSPIFFCIINLDFAAWVFKVVQIKSAQKATDIVHHKTVHEKLQKNSKLGHFNAKGDEIRVVIVNHKAHNRCLNASFLPKEYSRRFTS